jgi:DNA-binding response OmpR family regulator
MNKIPNSLPKTGSRRRILVVDDEPEVTHTLSRILAQNGFDVWAVIDPLKVLEQAAGFRPDLIILDFDMPKLLGPELSTLLRGRAETREVPIVFLSGMTDQDHHEIGTFSGGAAYLDKPLDVVKLLETIHALLGRPEPPG